MEKTPGEKTRIVEIIGPPGVGKSTLYKAIKAKWNANQSWISQEQLLSIKKPPIGQIKAYLLYYFKKIVSKEYASTPHVDLGVRFINGNQELCSFLWEYINLEKVYSHEMIDKKYRSLHFLYRDFSRYQAIWEEHDRRPCFIEEGLLEKSFFILPDKQFVEKSLDEYFKYYPKPAAIVYIDTQNVDMVIDRLLSRRKVIASHAGMTKEELKEDIMAWQSYFQIVLAKLEEANVKICRVNAEDGIEVSVKAVLDKVLS